MLTLAYLMQTTYMLTRFQLTIPPAREYKWSLDSRQVHGARNNAKPVIVQGFNHRRIA